MANEIKQVQLPGSDTKYDLIAKNGSFYIEGTGSTAGTWLGTHDGITSYYPGLSVLYKIPVAGASSTTLNINGLGAVKVVRNVSTAISTAYSAKTIIPLVYTVDDTTAYWKIADYNTTYSEATQSKSGLMSAADKGAFDMLESDAIVGLSASGTTVTYTRNDGSTGTFQAVGTIYPLASTTTQGLMSPTDKEKLDATNVAYGTCTTAAATAAKVITTSNNTNWELVAGSLITVSFSNTNSANNPTFNVNGTGAKSVKYQSSVISTSSLNRAGRANVPITYMYDGTYYRFIGWGYDENTDVNVTQTVTTSDAEYPILLAPNGQTATKTTTSYFDSGVTLNPSTNTIAANISGSANKLAIIQSVSTSNNNINKYALLAEYNIPRVYAGYIGTISMTDRERQWAGTFHVKFRTTSTKDQLYISEITWLSLNKSEIANSLLLTHEIEANTSNSIVRLYWCPPEYGITPMFTVINEYGDNYITSRPTTISSYTDTYLGTLVATSTAESALNAATATKATQDASGNVITSTYVTNEKFTNLVGDETVASQISDAMDDAITGLSVSGKVVTYTKGDGSTGTITTQDTDTKNTAGSTNTSNKIYLIGATSQAANPQTYSHDTVYVNTDGSLVTNEFVTGSTIPFFTTGYKGEKKRYTFPQETSQTYYVKIKNAASFEEQKFLFKTQGNNTQYMICATISARSYMGATIYGQTLRYNGSEITEIAVYKNATTTSKHDVVLKVKTNSSAKTILDVYSDGDFDLAEDCISTTAPTGAVEASFVPNQTDKLFTTSPIYAGQGFIGDLDGNAATATKATNADLAASADAANVKLLEDGTDLNTIKEAGYYGCRYTATNATLVNSPVTDVLSGLLLKVYNIEGAIYQELSSFVDSGIWKRRYQPSNSTWDDWMLIPSMDELRTPITIEANSNLNDLTESGIYMQASVNDSKTIANNPLSNLSTGILVKVYDSGTRVIYQELHGILEGSIYKRRRNSSNSWSEWTVIATTNDVKAVKDLIGDTSVSTQISNAFANNIAAQASRLATTQGVSSSTNKVDKYALLTTYTIDATWSGYHGIIAVADKEGDVSGIFNVKIRTGSDKGVITSHSIRWLSLNRSTVVDSLKLTQETDATTGNCVVRLYWQPHNANITPYFTTIYENGYNYITSRPATISSYTDTYLGTLMATSSTTSALDAASAVKADKLSTARTIALSGGATGTATSFDGSANISIPVTNVDPAYIGEGVTSKRWYLNISSEGNGVIVPFICNDLAFMDKRGGSVKVYIDGVETADSNISKLFDGTINYWSRAITNVGEIALELTLPTSLPHSQVVYADFLSSTYRAKSIKLEVMNSNYANDVWTQKKYVTNYDKSAFYQGVSHTPVGGSSSNGFNKIRFTFSDFNGASNFRIAEIGVVSYNGGAATSVCLSRGGGDMYGNITPYADGTGAIGQLNKKWNSICANNFYGNVTGGLTNIPDADSGSYAQNLIYHRGVTKQGTSTDRSFNSPFGNYSSNGTQIDYGSVLRISYDSTYYTDIWADANLKKGLTFHQVVNGTSQGWKTLLDSSNYGTYLGGVYAKKTDLNTLVGDTPVSEQIANSKPVVTALSLSVPTTGWTEDTTYGAYTQTFTATGATTDSDIYIDCPVGSNFQLIGARCLAANKITLYMSSVPTLAQNISIKLKKVG